MNNNDTIKQFDDIREVIMYYFGNNSDTDAALKEIGEILKRD